MAKTVSTSLVVCVMLFRLKKKCAVILYNLLHEMLMSIE